MSHSNNNDKFIQYLSKSRIKKARYRHESKFDRSFCHTCKIRVQSKVSYESNEWHYCYNCEQLFCRKHLKESFNGIESFYCCEKCPEYNTYHNTTQAIKIIKNAIDSSKNPKTKKIGLNYIRSIKLSNSKPKKVKNFNKRNIPRGSKRLNGSIKKELDDLRNENLNGTYWKIK